MIAIVKAADLFSTKKAPVLLLVKRTTLEIGTNFKPRIFRFSAMVLEISGKLLVELRFAISEQP